MHTPSCFFGLGFFLLFLLLRFGGDDFPADTSSSEVLQYLTAFRREVRTGGCRLIPASAIQSEYLLEESLTMTSAARGIQIQNWAVSILRMLYSLRQTPPYLDHHGKQYHKNWIFFSPNNYLIFYVIFGKDSNLNCVFQRKVVCWILKFEFFFE